MRRQSAILLALALTLAGPPLRSATPASAEDAPLGRWDITLQTPAGAAPSWLEIRRSGSNALVGQFVGVVGSARPISQIEVKDGELHFAIPAQWEGGPDPLALRARVEGDAMSGAITFPDRKRHPLTAVRAPSLRKPAGATVQWGEPIRLFNGKDLTGWRAKGESHWKVIDGVLRNTKGAGANLLTARKFADFKLHVELRLPAGSNSGVYLRGRYEVQIADSQGEPASDGLGAVYGFIAPSEDAGKGPDEWQSLDITLVGRRITVAVNGKTVICDQDIPGITGGALDSDEAAPGPLLLQGDHGPVEFRNLILMPAS
jgi:hypothetical protein